MTVGAPEVRVAAEEGEAGLAVIELARPPLDSRVTVAAVRALTAPVRIIRGMTAATGFGDSLVALAGMAGGTGHFRMSVGEWKTGGGVIEVSLPPGIGLVTGAAIGSQGAAMGVVFPVTGDTVGGRAAVGRVGGMTTGAGQ
jgi:hypothetical protein